MTSQLSAIEALSMIPGWDSDDVEVQTLPGGLTNRTYRVRIRNSDCVLRLDSERSQQIDFDRTLEEQIMHAAAAAGIGPSVYFSSPTNGILLREFLPGSAWTKADLDSTKNLEALAEILRRCHDLPPTGVSINLADYARTYLNFVGQEHGLYSFAKCCVAIVDSVEDCKKQVCAHNDIVAANVIDHGALALIDWEYACDNDPMFDLASAICYHDLNDSQMDILFNAYLGGRDSAWRERLVTQLRVYDAIHWLWLAARYLEKPTHEQVTRLEVLRRRIG